MRKPKQSKTSEEPSVICMECHLVIEGDYVEYGDGQTAHQEFEDCFKAHEKRYKELEKSYDWLCNQQRKALLKSDREYQRKYNNGVHLGLFGTIDWLLKERKALLIAYKAAYRPLSAENSIHPWYDRLQKALQPYQELGGDNETGL